MIHRRELLVVIGLVIALSVTVATGGVSSVTADRGVEVTVAEDDEAFLGVEQQATKANGTTPVVVTVRNQYPGGATFSTVAVTVNETTVDLAKNSSIRPGTSRTNVFHAAGCDDTISVEAEGPSVQISVERDVICNKLGRKGN